MKITTRHKLFLTAVLVGSTLSYGIGVTGVNPQQALTEARCRSGAFIAHSNRSDAVAADAKDDSSANVQTVGDQTGSKLVDTLVSGPNLFKNPGLERSDGTLPAGWFNNSYGSNESDFRPEPGHDSAVSVRTSIARYSDGNAGWFSEDLAVKPGGYYEFTDWYKASVSTRAVLMLKSNTGLSQYVNLATAKAAKDWSQYRVRFYVPTNVATIKVSHPLAAKGVLDIDDYSLREAQPTGLSEPLVSVTFDDGWASIHNVALPIMQRYGITSTQYIISGHLATPGYMTPSQVFDFRDRGHEIASHTVDHLDLTTQNDKVLKYQLAESRKNLDKCFTGATDFAAPYGDYNTRTTSVVSKYYQTARSVDVGFNSLDNFNAYEIKVQNVKADTSHEQMEAWIETAKQNHTWLVLVYHQVENTGGPFTRKSADFERDMQDLKVSGVPVKTMHDAFAEVKPQL